jgi:hypothetical protein
LPSRSQRDITVIRISMRQEFALVAHLNLENPQPSKWSLVGNPAEGDDFVIKDNGTMAWPFIQ